MIPRTMEQDGFYSSFSILESIKLTFPDTTMKDLREMGLWESRELARQVLRDRDWYFENSMGGDSWCRPPWRETDDVIKIVTGREPYKRKVFA